jgi:hypothetical protein
MKANITLLTMMTFAGTSSRWLREAEEASGPPGGWVGGVGPDVVFAIIGYELSLLFTDEGKEFGTRLLWLTDVQYATEFHRLA